MVKSLSYALCEKVLLIAKTKENFINEANVTKFIITRRKENLKPFKIPLAISVGFIKHSVSKMDYYLLNQQSNKVVIYFHGGSFVQRPLAFHFSFVKKITKTAKCKLYFPIYPLAPDNQHQVTHEKLEKMYNNILKHNPNNEIILMGDSAGGTLCFTFYAYLMEKKLPLPSKIIAISPCMDSSFSNEDIIAYNKKDIMLHSYGCGRAIQTWIGDTPLDNPEVNPMFLNPKLLPDTIIFVGGNEIMYPDIIKYQKKAKDCKVKIDIQKESACGHCYPLYPVPEAKNAIDIIISKIKKELQ